MHRVHVLHIQTVVPHQQARKDSSHFTPGPYQLAPSSTTGQAVQPRRQKDIL